MEHSVINFLDIEENLEYAHFINNIIEKCFQEEKMSNKNLYVNIVLTDPDNIKTFNKNYRNIDKETDVLSFPMFEKDEISNLNPTEYDILGDVVISIDKVKRQAIEYSHSFERELSYMLVHGFYHLMGYDHIEEQDKIEMRQKEENILNKLKILR